MSTDYFDDVQEVSNQPAAQQAAPADYVPASKFAELESKFQQLSQNPLQSLGYQPIQKENNFDPEAVAQAKQFLEMQGVVTKADLEEHYQKETERYQNMIASEAGYVDSEHVIADYKLAVYNAQKAGDAQKIAELTQVAQLWDRNPKAAIQAFQKATQKNNISSQEFGNLPNGNPQQSNQAPRFASVGEYHQWKASQIAAGKADKVRAFEADWLAGKVPDPY